MRPGPSTGAFVGVWIPILRSQLNMGTPGHGHARDAASPSKEAKDFGGFERPNYEQGLTGLKLAD